MSHHRDRDSEPEGPSSSLLSRVCLLWTLRAPPPAEEEWQFWCSYLECCCGGKMIQWTSKCLLSNCEGPYSMSPNDNCTAQSQKQEDPKAGCPLWARRKGLKFQVFQARRPHPSQPYLFSEYFFAFLSQLTGRVCFCCLRLFWGLEMINKTPQCKDERSGHWCPQTGYLTLGIIYRILRRHTEKAMAPHSSTLAWKTPRTEEPGRLQSMGSRRVGLNWATSLSLFTFMHWRRKWQPTLVSCLENPRDGGAWWAAVYGVAQSRTRLKWLSSSSSSKTQPGVSQAVVTNPTSCLNPAIWLQPHFYKANSNSLA